MDLKRQENNNTDGVKETQYLCRKSRANSQRDKLAAKIEVRGSRQKKSGMQDRQELKEKNQRRSLSSSCIVFLMRSSMVVSHWSNREMVSNSFTESV